MVWLGCDEDDWTTAGPDGRCVIDGFVEWKERKVVEKVEARERAVSDSGMYTAVFAEKEDTRVERVMSGPDSDEACS